MLKKKEIWILVGLVVVSLLGVLLFSSSSKESVMVSILHGDEVVQTFDPQVDGNYVVQGDYGTLEVEVRDGKWHVIHEQCPNHICSKMGWVSVEDMVPITCLPNNVIILVEEK